LVLLTEGIYDYALEVASWGMIYLLSFIKIDSGIQTLLAGDMHTDIHPQTEK
jgi:hypothetical protein